MNHSTGNAIAEALLAAIEGLLAIMTGHGTEDDIQPAIDAAREAVAMANGEE